MDSMGKDIGVLKDTRVICQRGATPLSMLTFIRLNRDIFSSPKIILLHVGTNYFGSKTEWSLFQNFKKGRISEPEYERQLKMLNPLPAARTPSDFQKTFEDIIQEIRSINTVAQIIISGIIPRPYDYHRRKSDIEAYNLILHTFNSQHLIYYIPTFKPFLSNSLEIKEELFQEDVLHLSNRGSIVLRSFVCDKLNKAENRVLK